LIDDKSNTGENEKGCIMKANLFPTHRFPPFAVYSRFTMWVLQIFPKPR